MDKVQGKWVKEVYKLCGENDNVWEILEPYLDKIDVLLQIAASETENEFLHDDIMELIKDG